MFVCRHNFWAYLNSGPLGVFLGFRWILKQTKLRNLFSFAFHSFVFRSNICFDTTSHITHWSRDFSNYLTKLYSISYQSRRAVALITQSWFTARKNLRHWMNTISWPLSKNLVKTQQEPDGKRSAIEIHERGMENRSARAIHAIGKLFIHSQLTFGLNLRTNFPFTVPYITLDVNLNQQIINNFNVSREFSLSNDFHECQRRAFSGEWTKTSLIAKIISSLLFEFCFAFHFLFFSLPSCTSFNNRNVTVFFSHIRFSVRWSLRRGTDKSFTVINAT